MVPESRLRERRRKARSARLAILCGLVFLFFVGLILLSRAPFLRVTTVKVAGASSPIVPQVEAAARAQMLGAYGYLFARNNILLYPHARIVASLLTQFPQLKSVSVRTENVHTIEVSVVERQSVALWCGAGGQSDQVSQIFSASSSALARVSNLSAPALTSTLLAKQECFFIDSNGRVYAPATNDTQGDYQKYFGVVAGQGLPKQYLTPEQFISLAAFVAALGGASGGERVAGVEVDDQMNGVVHFVSGFELRFLLGDGPGDVLQRFALAQTSSAFAGHKLADFAYLDLRFGDKIYYKLKNK